MEILVYARLWWDFEFKALVLKFEVLSVFCRNMLQFKVTFKDNQYNISAQAKATYI